MHLNPLPEYLELAKKEFQSLTNKPIIILSTKSTNDAFGIAKSLLDSQVKNLVKEIKDLGLFPISLNHHNQYVYEQLEVEQRQMIHPQLWIAYIAAADYVISVDTATFHIAGGLKKPLVGIFSFTDGKIYGKYYDFILVQKHRDNGNWPCGPCFNHYECPRELHCPVKPCLTELSFDEIAQGLHSALNKWPWKQTP
jgi:ADP-heptose:LPS heptosyltransferase